MDSALPQESNSNLTENSVLTTNIPTSEQLPPDSVNLKANSPQQTPKKPSKFSLKKIIIVAVVLAVGILLFTYFHHTAKSTVQTKVYKVGILDSLQAKFGETANGFEQGMTSLGYIQGKNITYDVENKGLTGNQNTFQKFIRDKDNLVVVIPTEPTEEAEEYLKDSGIPIISLAASFEGTSLINSIQQPGHNLTGVRYPGPEDSAEALSVLHQLAPNDTRVLSPYLAGYPNVPGQLAALQAEAKTLGMTVTPEPLAPNKVSTFVAGLSPTNPGFDAIVGMAEPFDATPSLNGPLYDFANQHNIPIVGNYISNNDTGPIAYVGPSSNEMGRLAAPLAVKIFNGTHAGTLPILTPVSKLQINLKIAQRSGITPDAGLLSTASVVIR